MTLAKFQGETSAVCNYEKHPPGLSQSDLAGVNFCATIEDPTAHTGLEVTKKIINQKASLMSHSEVLRYDYMWYQNKYPKGNKDKRMQ